MKIHECPKCGRVAKSKKEIEKWFGFRRMKPDADPVPQSYCRKDRALEAADKRALAKALAEATKNEKIPLTIRHGKAIANGHSKPDGRRSPAPVVFEDAATVVPIYGSRKHKPGELVCLANSFAVYRVGKGGALTAVTNA